MKPRILLASSSPYRRMLLDRLSFPYTCQSPQIDESPRAGEPPHQLSQRLATEKAKALAPRFPDRWIIGSDQVAARNGALLGKPGSVENARRQLLASSGREVSFYTSVTVLNSATGHFDSETDITRVRFRQLTEEDVIRYVSIEKPLDCAGSFKVEGLGITLFERVDSSDPTALIGLPLILLTSMLRRQGFDPLDPGNRAPSQPGD